MQNDEITIKIYAYMTRILLTAVFLFNVLLSVPLLHSCTKQINAEVKKRPTVNQPPVVSFIYPTNGSTVTGTITVRLNASSTVGIRSTGLMLTVNGFNCIFGNDIVAPYEFTWNTNSICLTNVLPGQQVTLRGSATDNNGVVRFNDIIVTKN